MPYNEYLAERISRVLKEKSVHFESKKMMGGLAFMVDDKMCLGVIKEELMARVGPDAEEEALKMKGSRPMDFTGRPMKGYLFVSAEGIDLEKDLEKWVQLCLDFNPLAKSSKKK